jgi:hypothetical protein
MEWDDDSDLRKSIKAATRNRNPADVEDVTEVLAAVETVVAQALGRSLTREQRTRLSRLVRRPSIEPREIYEQVMSWRTGLTTRQIRQLRGIASFRGR